MKIIKILNYGNGNIGSLLNTFNLINYPASIVKDINEISDADLLVLPGVGSAVTSSNILKDKVLIEALNNRNLTHKPILGICLGAQLFFEYLQESGQEGLAWESGSVDEMYSYNTGWGQLNWEQLVNYSLNTGLNKNDSFYFNHRYKFPTSKDMILNVIFDAEKKIPSIFLKNHLCGIQFHPEKSQSSGTKILRNILKIQYGL